MVEHLSVVKILIEKVAKYLLLPGLDLELNINIRVRTVLYINMVAGVSANWRWQCYCLFYMRDENIFS